MKLFGIFLFIPSIVWASTVGRIYCQPTDNSQNHLVTLRSDSPSHYYAPIISFFDENSQPITEISNVIVASSNPLKSRLFLKARGPNKNNYIYEATVDIGGRKAIAKKISALSLLSPSTISILHRNQVSPQWIAHHEEKKYLAYISNDENENIIIQDLQKNQILLKFKDSSKKYFNPSFTENAEWLKLEYVDDTYQSINAVFVSLKNPEDVITLAPTQESKLNIQLYKNEVFWTIQTKEKWKIIPQITWQLFVQPIVNFNDQKPQLTIELDYHSIYTLLPISNSSVNIVLTSENTQQPSLNIYTYNYEKQAISKPLIQKYPLELMEKLKRQPAYGNPILTSPLYNPYSDHLLFSIGTYKGILSYQLQTRQFEFHSSYEIGESCKALSIGIEDYL